MVICIKCGKEQSRRSSSECEYKYVYDERGDIEHAWVDRGEFIDELRKKLFPFIRERIAEWRKKHAEKETLYASNFATYNKKLNDLQAAHDVYLNEGIPRIVNNEKRRARRKLLLEVIGSAIGIFIVLKWIFPKFDLEITDPWVIFAMIVLVVVFVGKSVLDFLKLKRYAESQEFADKLSGEWLVNNGYNKLVSDLKTEKDNRNSVSGSYGRCIHDAERALAGNDEELLHFYNMDKQTKNYYIKKIYEGAW